MEENQLSAPRYVVVIGGSAGSLDVLLQVLPLLENIEKIAIVIVVHRKIRMTISSRNCSG
jgi:two-component system chemotaxis response regulator CheB